MAHPFALLNVIILTKCLLSILCFADMGPGQDDSLILGPGTGGEISSPNYPALYSTNLRLSWKISVSPGNVILLTFKKPFETESCSYDYLKVTERTSLESVETKMFCGSVLPEPFVSKTSMIELEFITDSSTGKTGFLAVWKEVVNLCRHSEMSETGEITYPHGHYDHGFGDCSWNIAVPLGMFVQFKFYRRQHGLEPVNSKTNTSECQGDVIEIFDVMSNDSMVKRGQWCDFDDLQVVRGFGSRIHVKFQRQKNTSEISHGFSATWRGVHDCGGVFTEQEGQLMSYNYPSSDGNDYRLQNNNCTWEIDRHPTVFHIQLSASEGNCDRLQILDYSEELNGEAFLPRKNWCVTNSTTHTVTSLGPKTRLVYQQQGNESSGLFVSWEKTPGVCGDRYLYESTGAFSFPDTRIVDYSPNMNCEWVIQANNDQWIHLNFNSIFDIESSNDPDCVYDYVEVLDSMPGGNLVSHGRFCGTSPPQELVSSSNTMVIRFRSDDSKQGRGFSVTWDATCGKMFKTLEGSVTSPSFPSHYPENFQCEWEIQVPDGYIINLMFSILFSLENNIQCEADFLEIYDYDLNGNRSKKGRWCGQDMPPLQTSITSRMAVVFRSDARKNYPGFFAQWKSHEIGCSRSFNYSDGTFSTPGFPQPYPGNQSCRWEINVPPGQRVRLEFGSIFDLESDKDGCRYDDVEVFDSLSNGTLISYGKWCNVRAMPVLYSTSSLMVVTFRSDGDKNGQGFSASWSSVSPCGNFLDGRFGHLLSPRYPSHYPENVHCLWDIGPALLHNNDNSNNNNSITLHFDPVFELESSLDCSSDYLEIYRNGDLIRRWCGTDVPDDVTSDGTLTIIFHSDKSVTRKGFYASWY